MKYLGIIATLFALFTLTSCLSQEQSEENTAQQNQTQASTQQENNQNNQQDMQESIGEAENSTMIQQDDTMIDESKSNQESIQDEEAAVMQEAAMMEEASTQGEIETTTELRSGEYTAYDASLIGARENTVIFFGADWCPGCVQADKNFMNEDIPENLTVLKADFDTDIELRKKYGVVAQHTFVVVDDNGEEIKKWVGGYTADDIIEKL